MLKLNHKKLAVWDKSLRLIKEVYKLTNRLPKEEKYLASWYLTINFGAQAQMLPLP